MTNTILFVYIRGENILYYGHYKTMEVIVMDVEKIIRVLGYIVYTALWLPVIVLAIVITPIVWIAMYVRAGRPVKEGIDTWRRAFMEGIQHDMEFIQTGKW